MSFDKARRAAYRAGQALRLRPVSLALEEADGTTLAVDLCAAADLPSFPAAAVDGYATRGTGPWLVRGQVLAGQQPRALTEPGTCAQIATGAMVPTGADAILRTEDATLHAGRVHGTPRPRQEWRLPGEEALHGDLLATAGTLVTPTILGLAAAAGHDRITVYPSPRTAVIVLGSELQSHGIPVGGRIRDALGPQLPAWLNRLGTRCSALIGPVPDDTSAVLAAIGRARTRGAHLIVTTGGTMHGPADHLRDALTALGAGYQVSTVAIRPGFPMLLATLPSADDQQPVILVGLPGNPQPAIIGVLTLTWPALAGLTGQELPALPVVELGTEIAGRGTFTHAVPVSLQPGGRAVPATHTGPAMLRGLAQSAGFAIIPAGHSGQPGQRVALLPLPLTPAEQA